MFKNINVHHEPTRGEQVRGCQHSDARQDNVQCGPEYKNVEVRFMYVEVTLRMGLTMCCISGNFVFL